MSGPGRAHEHRVALLGQVADLAGLRDKFDLGAGLAPDVSRTDAHCRHVLVGDAKGTETPGCVATGRRLRRYAVALLGLAHAGVAVRLVLGVPPRGDGGRGWLTLLQHSTAPMPVSGRGRINLDDSTTLIWLDLRPFLVSHRGEQVFDAETAGQLDEQRLVD